MTTYILSYREVIGAAITELLDSCRRVIGALLPRVDKLNYLLNNSINYRLVFQSTSGITEVPNADIVFQPSVGMIKRLTSRIACLHKSNGGGI